MTNIDSLRYWKQASELVYHYVRTISYQEEEISEIRRRRLQDELANTLLYGLLRDLIFDEKKVSTEISLVFLKLKQSCPHIQFEAFKKMFDKDFADLKSFIEENKMREKKSSEKSIDEGQLILERLNSQDLFKNKVYDVHHELKRIGLKVKESHDLIWKRLKELNKEPAIYGVNDDPHSFNRTVNSYINRKIRKN